MYFQKSFSKGKISENVKRIISKHNINIILTVDSKLNKIIKLGKDVLEKNEISNVVYKLECLSCDKTYVGQTKRLLNIRREEHKNNFNLKNKKYHNVITKHRTENIGEDEEPHDLIGITYRYYIKKTTYINVYLQK